MSERALPPPLKYADLAAWLTQIWDEQEQAAQEAHDLTLHTPWAGPVVGKHLELNAEPLAVLARIAADRQILAIHEPDPRDTSVCGMCGEPLEYCWPWSCDTVKALALPYADRPGYREEWRAAGERQEQ